MKKKLDASVFKQEWQRPPQWRWQQAMENFADPYMVSDIKKDPYLYRVCRFYKYRKRWRDTPKHTARRYPDVTAALDCYTDTAPSGWKWYLEALMLTDADDKQIAKLLHNQMSPDTVNMYRKLFFDTDIYEGSETAVDVNIFGATREAVATYNNYDYTWKLIAYTWGVDKFMKYASVKKKKVDKQIREWFEEVIQDRVIEHTFHLSSNMRLMYNESAVNIMEMASKFWTVDEQDLSEMNRRKKDEYLENLLASTDNKLMRADRKIGREEPRQYYAKTNK